MENLKNNTINLEVGKTLTENGMVTYTTSLNKCVDLFFSIGSMRGKSEQKVVELFEKAYNENPLVASKILFWVRDVRGGAGERKVFRDILKFLTVNSPNLVRKNISLISEFGRWDDILVLVDTELENDMFQLIKTELTEGNKLLAKWLPRKGYVANKLRKMFKQTPKEYRKMLVNNTNVVETLMCAREWEKIEYSKLPSLASSRYQKSFIKNDGVRYEEYKETLLDGTGKVNAGAVYPYDIIKSLNNGGDVVVNNKQWESLPNWMEDSVERILPVVDVSGSMDVSVGDNPNLTCMDVAISLGIYISERNIGSFKDAFITFSERPSLEYLNGTLEQRLRQLRNAHWGMSTNLESVFQLILTQAKNHKISEDRMPTKILILSDMEFNQAVDTDKDSTSYNMIEEMYNEAGYKKPDIIFWNLNGKGGNFPVRHNEEGVALVSGFSPSILKSLLGGKNLTPEDVMMETIGSDRYSLVTI